MTKEDKLFFTGLIRGLEDRLDGHDKRFDSIDKRFEQVDKRFEQVDKRFNKLEERVEENSRGIRYNGMQIELMRDDLAQIKEGDSFSHELNAKVDAVMESMGIDIPVLKRTVAGHSEKIRALEAKCG
ncbi:hypothetical protein KJ657_02465 [Patescibacteria group bacterium]|nr:hypothetical protein [Patescibacteria group bacterium]